MGGCSPSRCRLELAQRATQRNCLSWPPTQESKQGSPCKLQSVVLLEAHFKRRLASRDDTPLSFWHCIYGRTRHQHPRGREQNPRLASAARVWVLPVARPGSARIAFFRSSEFGFRISARVIPVWPGVCFASNCDSLTFWGVFGGSARVYSPPQKIEKRTSVTLIWAEGFRENAIGPG